MAEQSDDTSRSIRQTNAMIRALVEQETLGYPFWIGGVVTRCFISDFGHIYFDLSDEDHSISCMIRERIRGTMDFTISNGMEVEVYGTIRVYEKAAKVQMEVEQARLIERPASVSDTNLVEHLQRKGLWPRSKRPLPERIERIGLITSKQSDALHDFEDTYRNEGGIASIRLIDVRLQGQQAPREIADAINRLNQDNDVDVIALIRGGGRVAELTVFDDLFIAEAICRSAIPVLTGIGHQRNETFADRVADVATITPTAAASFLAKKRAAPTEEQKSPASSYAIIAIIGIGLLIVVLLLLSR